LRKLLNTLYILSEDSYMYLDGENIVINREENAAARFPLHNFENIVSFSFKGASPALMGACAEKDIGLSFFSPYGKFLARINGRQFGNVLLRKAQYRIAENDSLALEYAKNMILGKCFNCRQCLERTIRDHSERVDCEKLSEASAKIKAIFNDILQCTGFDELRGIEGQAAENYFSVFNELIINQKDEFVFSKRTRRPPLDNVNALLSFAYAILAGECANALESVGLDPYVGFMHTIRPGRKSLALDIMEELRAIMADRLVLTLINTKVIKNNFFDCQSDGAVLLNEEGRKCFFTAWQTRKKETIIHPFLKEKVEWGIVPYIQAMLMARVIRGDLDQYPPFLWK